jgi:formylglycine-generating enzyme required for sulfatase activity
MAFHHRQVHLVRGTEYVLYGIDAELHHHLAEGGRLAWLGIEGLSDQLIQALGGREQQDRVKAAQPLVERIFEGWPALGAYPFGRTLAEFEFEGTFYRGHRDHVVHQLRVFLLGLYLWDGCPAIREAMRACPEWGASDEATFRRRWALAALFHDVGYVFEAQDPGTIGLQPIVARELETRLGYPLTALLGGRPGYASLRTVEQELAEELGLPRAPAVQSVSNLWRPRRGAAPLAALEPAALLARLAGCTEPLDAYFRMAKEKRSTRSPGRPCFHDHGVAGAMLLMRLHQHWHGYLGALHGRGELAAIPGLTDDVARLWRAVEPAGNDVRAAAAAIALHNVADLWNPGEARDEVGLLLDGFSISQSALPLPFLLRFCDGLQEWDRPRRCLWDEDLPPLLSGQELWARAEGGRLVLAFPRDESRFEALLAELDRGLDGGDVRALLGREAAVAAPSTTPEPPATMGTGLQAFERALLDWTVRECRFAALMGLMRDRANDLGLEEIYVPVCVRASWLGREGEGWDLWDHRACEAEAPPVRRGRATPHGEVARTSLHHGSLAPGVAALLPEGALPFEALIGVAGLQRLALLGEPGAGKTTVLRILALRLAQALRGEAPAADGIFQPGALGPRESWPVPVLLPLRELPPWMESRNVLALVLTPGRLREWIRDQCHDRCAVPMPVGFLDDALARGHLWLMFDALDEVPDEQTRMAAAQAIKGLAEQCPHCRVTLTARTREYSGAVVLSLEPELRTMEIAPLSRPLAERFGQRWTAARWRGDGDPPGAPPDGYLQGLLRAVHDPRLAGEHLVGNPLLLTAVAVVYDDERRLPDSRAELYERCCEVLVRLRQWCDGPACCPPLFDAEPGREAKLGLLMVVARDMHERQAEETDREALLELLEGRLPQGAPPVDAHTRRELAEVLLERLLTRSSLLVATADGRGAHFFHRSFRDFLVARAMAGEPLNPRERVDGLSEVQLGRWWRQTLVFLAGWHGMRAPQVAYAFMEALLARAAVSDSPLRAEILELVGMCLAELPQVRDRALVDRFAAAVTPEVARSTWPLAARAALADRLGELGVARVGEPEFRPIRGGRFWMGAQDKASRRRNFDSGAVSWEAPVREVALPAFEIARFPVTVGQFARFVAAGGYRERDYWCEEGFAWRERQGVEEPGSWEEQRAYLDRPVTEVSWYEARAFAAWFTASRQDGWRYALPSEAQWERAARGPAGRSPFPWGDGLRAGEQVRANTRETELGRPSPVGLFPAGCSVEEVEELAGNVWEWCGDQMLHYSDGSPFTRKEIPWLSDDEARSDRVVRGGSWINPAWYCRVSFRLALRPSARWGYVGLRLVRSGP